MIAYIILIIFSVLLIFVSIILFIKKNFFVSSKIYLIRKIPFILAISMGGFVFSATIYFNRKRDAKIEEFDLLKLEAKNLDTSMSKNEILSTPIDIFSTKKMDTLKSLNKKILEIKDYLSSKNMFSKVEPEIQDSINKTYLSISNKQKLISQNNLNHGYIYGGVGNGVSWTQNNFKNITHQDGKIPCIGDKLLCIKPIFIRAGETHKIDGQGWVNQQLLGTLKEGRVIVVKEVILFPNNYFWIRF